MLPIAGPPIPGGSVTVDGGRVVDVSRQRAASAVDLGRCAVLPALVNAHIHLELSYLRGRIPRAARFTDWVRPLLAARREAPAPDAVASAATSALDEARRAGTGIFGDVSNTLAAVPALRASGTPAHVFHELLGFSVTDAERPVAEARARIAEADGGEHLTFSLAPHAPYSVSAALFAAIRRDSTAHAAPTSVHLAESPEEVQLLADGSGPWRPLLEALGVWPDGWQPPGVSPVAYLERSRFIDGSTLVVHGVQCTAADIARIRASGATLVSCPRSNAFVGAGTPPLTGFYEAGVPVAFGTDSLASVEDLNLFSEIAAARRVAPGVSAARLLESATATGARALGFGAGYGTIEPGKQAALIAVRVPDGVSDVEEYLVSGIDPRAVGWVDTGAPAPVPR